MCICPVTITAADAIIVDISPQDIPDGAVILIMDGVSSYYVYPEYTPYALDGSVLDKAEVRNMSFLFDQGCRAVDITVPQTYTEAGHSVLISGYSKAIGELVEGSGTTIYDVAHDYDYLCFAIMEKGDFSAMCNKQDVIVHDTSNSVNKPEMIVETNIDYNENKKISMDVADLFQEEIRKLRPELDLYPEASLERYNAYNIWAIETAIETLAFMGSEYPDEHYIITINVGATDSAGHYKKDSGYIATIEGVDSVCKALYDACVKNEMALILTADHGMAFPEKDSRGGHQSKTYSVANEAQKVPFLIVSKNVDRGIIKEEHGQEDLAPTILSVMGLPNELRIADGSEIPVKKYSTISVKAFEAGDITILENGKIVGRADDTDNSLFRGVRTGSDYTIRFVSNGAKTNVMEKDIHFDGSESIVFNSYEDKVAGSNEPSNLRHIIGGMLIGAINISGLLLIRKTLKE